MTNGNPEYKLGELTQFKEDVLRRLERIELRIGNIERKVEGLGVWKAKVIGASSAVSALVVFVLKYVLK